MENNGITLKNENGYKKKYKVLMTMNGEDNKDNIIVYTDNVERKDGYTNMYSIKINIDGTFQGISDDEFKFLKSFMNSLQKEE